MSFFLNIALSELQGGPNSNALLSNNDAEYFIYKLILEDRTSHSHCIIVIYRRPNSVQLHSLASLCLLIGWMVRSSLRLSAGMLDY